VRAQGQGLRQGEVSGVSSVESEKQIQHFLTSSVDGAGDADGGVGF